MAVTGQYFLEKLSIHKKKNIFVQKYNLKPKLNYL